MTQHEVQIPAPAGSAPASLHIPDGAGPWRAVILYPDAGGLRETFRDMGERLAQLGYVVLVPDVYYRKIPWGPFDVNTVFADEHQRSQLMALMHSVSTEDIVRDTRAFIDYLAARDEVAVGPIGTTGYCMGGRLSLIVAGHLGPLIGATASFHGGNIASADDPQSPHRRADSIAATVYVAGAIEDRSFPDDQRDRLAEALSAAGVSHVIETYPAHHGFAVPDNDTYDEAAAERHWDALADLYGRALIGP